jgi:hypothetical protein
MKEDIDRLRAISCDGDKSQKAEGEMFASMCAIL